MKLHQQIGLGAVVLGFGAAAAVAEPQVAIATGGQPAVAVIDPTKVVATVHAKNLDATLAVIKDYLPVPLKKDALVSELFGEFAPLVSLAAAADLVVALDTGDAAAKISDSDGGGLKPPLWAFSVGIRSLDEAYKLFQSRGYISDGKLGWSRLALPVAGRRMFCLLSTGQPAASGRLSCSKQERDRDAVGPYLARLAAPAGGPDIHAELSVVTLVRTYDEPWQRALGMVGMMMPTRFALGQPTFDRALTDLTQALIAQVQGVSSDLQSLSLDLGLAPSGIDLKLAYRLAGQSSWWGQADAESASRPATGVPPLYFSLPTDVTSAAFQVSDPKWARQLLKLLSPLLDGFLTHDGLAAADRQAVGELLTKLVDPAASGPVTTVSASGKSDNLAAEVGRIGDPALLLGGGFYLVATDGPTAKLAIPWLKALVATYNRPAIQAYLRAKWKKYELGPVPPTLRFDPLPKTVGAGAVGVTLSGQFALPSRSKLGPNKPMPLTLHLISVPAGDKVWSAFGSDRPTLIRRLSEQGKLAPAQTLAQRPGLSPLSEPGVLSGGFTSLVSLGSYLDAALAGLSKRSSDGKERSQSAAQLFNMAPHHGEVPMNYTSRSSSNSSGRTSEILLRVPRLVIEDLATLVLQLAMEK